MWMHAGFALVRGQIMVRGQVASMLVTAMRLQNRREWYILYPKSTLPVPLLLVFVTLLINNLFDKCFEFVDYSLMRQKREERWPKALWRNILTIMNDGQPINQYVQSSGIVAH